MKILASLLCIAAAALAQEGTRINELSNPSPEQIAVPESPPSPGNSIAVTTMAPGAAVTGPIGFFGVEAALDEKVVTGAPYFADAVTEVTRTLADGNRITNTTKSSFYRDGQGRTRRETSFQLMGAVVLSGAPPRTIIISDPVAKVKYELEENTHRAHKISTAVSADQARALTKKRIAEARFTAKLSSASEAKPAGDVATENLGPQTISGVAAQGTRVTHTIPPGAIGNERAIEIVTETWYSPELQTVVLRKTTNPMEGDITFQLTNIQRAEPAQSMFEVPSDYTLVDGGKPRTFEFFVRQPDTPEE